MLRRQEELEKKAAELDRRERELQSHGATGQSLHQSESEWSLLIKARFMTAIMDFKLENT